MADEEVPRAVRALWGTEAGVRRGPKPAMSVRRIAATAVEIADADGLEAASMAGVAKRLGFTTMSLYRYVDSKADLQMAMVDEALGPPPEISRRLGWRNQLATWAEAEAARLGAHPWVLEVRLGSPPLGPHTLAWTDLGLQILGRAGLSPDRAASTLLFVDGYVRQQILLGLQYADGGAGWADRLRQVIPTGSLPALTQALEEGVFDDDSSDFPHDEFRFGLDLILDGAEKIRALAGKGSSRSPLERGT
jgi:AcrR family transcriptional regulator